MKIKTRTRSVGSFCFDVANYIFLILFSLLMLYPMVNIVAISLSDKVAVDKGLVSWLPIGFNLSGYEYMLSYEPLIRSYGMTIAYALGGTIITLCLTSLIAYPLSIPNFVLKKHITLYLSITMFFGGGMVPTYLILQKLKMLNTYWVMVLPGCVSAYNTFVFRSFFQGIPSALRESAYMDGAEEITIWWNIILPLSLPLLATYFLFTMVGHWNSWFNALLYLNDEWRYPLQMILRRLVVEDNLTQVYKYDAAAFSGPKAMHTKNAQMAAVVIAMVPILMVYPFLQKHFAKGVMVGAIKG